MTDRVGAHVRYLVWVGLQQDADVIACIAAVKAKIVAWVSILHPW